MSLKDELEKIGGVQDQLERFGTNLDVGRYAHDYLAESAARDRANALTPTRLVIRRPEERAAESFMEGLREHADKLEAGLREDQELHMLCYHGPERLRVLEISMPSENVVSLRCLNADGDETHVTGHMHAVTFSFVIHTIVPPEVKTPIGFRMPSDSAV